MQALGAGPGQAVEGEESVAKSGAGSGGASGADHWITNTRSGSGAARAVDDQRAVELGILEQAIRSWYRRVAQ